MTEYSFSDIINFAKQSQVNSQFKISKEFMFNGSSINPEYSRTLYLVRKAVEFMNNANPIYATLRQTAEYLFALTRPFLVNTATISITNPANRTINVGQSASFTVSVFVSNASPYTVQWYRNNVAIPGATGLTYTLTNAQVSDSGATFYATAISPGVGTVSSTTAVLVVNAVITGFFAWSADTDFYPILLTITDPFNYQTNFSISHNQPVQVPLPSNMLANVYMLVKVPIGESVKTIWGNTPLNFGTIPDSAFETIVQFGGYTYYASRGQISMDVTQPLTLS